MSTAGLPQLGTTTRSLTEPKLSLCQKLKLSLALASRSGVSVRMQQQQQRSYGNALLAVAVAVPGVLSAAWLHSDACAATTAKSPLCELGLYNPLGFVNLLFGTNVVLLFWIISVAQRSTWLIDPYWTFLPVLIGLFYITHPLATGNTTRATITFGECSLHTHHVFWMFHSLKRKLKKQDKQESSLYHCVLPDAQAWCASGAHGSLTATSGESTGSGAPRKTGGLLTCANDGLSK
jgi:hypothetical protein